MALLEGREEQVCRVHMARLSGGHQNGTSHRLFCVSSPFEKCVDCSHRAAISCVSSDVDFSASVRTRRFLTLTSWMFVLDLLPYSDLEAAPTASQITMSTV